MSKFCWSRHFYLFFSSIEEFLILSLFHRHRYGKNGEFVVVCCPTDQGYYEPDTSTLIRLKLASEYGYGIYPSSVVTDKVNLLGTGAHPFWRWLQGTLRSPAGLGRVQVRTSNQVVYGAV